MTARIRPDRPLTGAEKSKRHYDKHHATRQAAITKAGRTWRAKNREHYNETHKAKMARFRAAHASLCAQTTGVSQLEKDCAALYPGAVAQYRLPIDGVRRTADYAWPEDRVALFVDGDWWHGCPTHQKSAKTNAEYWAAKVARNQARDRDTDARLAEIGWQSVRLWECEVRTALQGAPRGRQGDHTGTSAAG